MSNSNSKQWSSATPGYIIFLVDQSQSMENEYVRIGNKVENKAVFTASVINRTIYELINTNMDGDKVKDRVFITIIGYGGKGGNSVDDVRSAYLSSFADTPIRIENKKQKQPDGNGGYIEVDVQQPIFIEAVAQGLTPMTEALEFAKTLIDEWLAQKPDFPAPVIINVSDGLPYSGDYPNSTYEDEQKAIAAAHEIMAINTSDGSPLIFNAHIGINGNEYVFSESESELNDAQAKFLFNISSKIPEDYKVAAQKHGLTVKPNSRGFVSNAEPTTLIQFINFGSSGGSDKKN